MSNFFLWLKSLFVEKSPSLPPLVGPNIMASKPAPIETQIRGLDVSHYQASLNWDEALKLGYRFAFAKATDGASGTDPMFTSHRREAKAAGIIFGAYHFLRFSVDPIIQAERLCNVAGPVLTGEFPHTIDVEWDRTSPRYSDGHTMDNDAADLALKCLERVEKITGMTPILYTNPYFFTNFIQPERFLRFIPWLSAYHTTADKVHIPAPWSKLIFWQDSEDFSLGAVKKIDTNVFSGSLADLQLLARK